MVKATTMMIKSIFILCCFVLKYWTKKGVSIVSMVLRSLFMAKNNMKTAYSLCYFFMIASLCTKQSQKCWDQCIHQQGCRERRGGGGVRRRKSGHGGRR